MSSRKRPASAKKEPPAKKQPINFLEIQEARRRNAHLLEQPSYGVPLFLQQPSLPVEPKFKNLADVEDYVPPYFKQSHQTAIRDFKAKKYPDPPALVAAPGVAPASPTYSSGFEKDPEKLEAHRIYDILRPRSPRTEKPSIALPTMTAKEQSKKLIEEDPYQEEAQYLSEDHRRRYAWGKTKRKKRRKPNVKTYKKT